MNQPVFARVRAAVLRAWAYVAVFAVAAAVLYRFGAARMPMHHSLRVFRTVVLAYAAGATGVAVLVAVLEPWRTTRLRRWAVGVIAAWPGCYVALGVLVGFLMSTWHAAFITAAACVYSAIVSGRKTDTGSRQSA